MGYACTYCRVDVILYGLQYPYSVGSALDLLSDIQ